MGSALFLTFWVQLICSMSPDPWGWAELKHLPFPRPTPLSPVCPGHVFLLQCHLSPLSKQSILQWPQDCAMAGLGRGDRWGRETMEGDTEVGSPLTRPGASPPSALCPGSSFPIYASPTSQSHQPVSTSASKATGASRDECGLDGLWEGERAWGASGSPDCVGDTERGGSCGEPRAC